jgi:hypothetical protein
MAADSPVSHGEPTGVDGVASHLRRDGRRTVVGFYGLLEPAATTATTATATATARAEEDRSTGEAVPRSYAVPSLRDANTSPSPSLRAAGSVTP